MAFTLVTMLLVATAKVEEHCKKRRLSVNQEVPEKEEKEERQGEKQKN